MIRFLGLSLNFWLVVILIVIILLYYLRLDLTSGNVSNYKLKQIPIEDSNEKIFNSDLQSLCKKKNPCYIIVYIVNNIHKIFNQDQLDKTLRFLNKDNNFHSIKDDVETFVVQKIDKNSNYKFLFHSDPKLKNKTTNYIDQKRAKNSTKCYKNALCKRKDVLDKMWEFIDNHPDGGILEYFWQPEGEAKKYIQRAMVRQLDRNTLVVSEFTVEVRSVYINYGIATVFIINMILFSLAWEFLQIETILNTPIISHSLYAIIIFGFLFNLFHSMNRNVDGTIFDAIEDVNFSSTIARGTASLAVGIAVFLTLVVKKDSKESVSHILSILCMCFIFLLLSIVKVGHKINFDNFILAADMTTNLAYNAIVYIILCILYIYYHSKSS